MQTTIAPSLEDALRQYWGYDSFLPLQEQSMNSVLANRDSLVVLPTGGGKSLCYQVPSLCKEGLAVVVSPLISLMKDQVDALTSCGVPAACINSSLSRDEQMRVADDVRASRIRLLYMAPERLVTERALEFLKGTQISFFAIDESHCISEWGHDFRPEYRQLQVLKQQFPNVGVHAYTATATERVRADIIRGLELDNPEILIGSFDRPNLFYKIARRNNVLAQIREVLDRHRGDSGIIYCISRKEVDRISTTLSELGYRVLPYHAGMENADRRHNQEAFSEEKVDIIVATVAFGMGIDKSNVRYVIHAGMPKSLENYQQESGRAGRDNLDAECHLFYSAGDFNLWKRIIADSEPQVRTASLESLSAISGFCSGVGCRHRALVAHFDQKFEADNCNACDVCLGQLDLVDDALVIGQKILSCIVRLEQNFGGDYTAMVLTGSKDQRILSSGHDRLSTWGILADHKKNDVRDWIEQLVGQKFLTKAGEFNVLQVTLEGRRLLRGEVPPLLLKSRQKQKSASTFKTDSWEGVDEGLFEALRGLRRETAADRELPPYMIFSDATLRDMARRRPATVEEFLSVRGVGDRKCRDFGEAFVGIIVDYCREHQLSTDVDVVPSAELASSDGRTATLPGSGAIAAFKLFRDGRTVDEVVETMGRALSTVNGYLTEFIRHERISDPSNWIDDTTTERIRTAAAEVGIDRLKPIFEHLDGTVGYDEIRVVVECLRNLAEA